MAKSRFTKFSPLGAVCADTAPGTKGGAMQFCGQFGIVQVAHGGIEIRWFVNVATMAPLGGKPHPALFPVRCPLPEPGPASLAAPSLVTRTAAPSLHEAS